MDQTLSFDQLPSAVNRLSQKLDDIEKILLSRQGKDCVETEKLLTVPEAAEYLSLAIPTIYGLIQKGEIPYMKRSKRVYFSSGDLFKYLREGRKKTNSEIAIEVDLHLQNKKRSNNGK